MLSAHAPCSEHAHAQTFQTLRVASAGGRLPHILSEVATDFAGLAGGAWEVPVDIFALEHGDSRAHGATTP